VSIQVYMFDLLFSIQIGSVEMMIG
jgi:hypothetical protein